MHVRFSTALGTPIVSEDDQEILGTVSGVLIHPDTGKIEGFFVSHTRFFSQDELFLQSQDIMRWGIMVHVRDADHIVPAQDIMRIGELLQDSRTILGQKIMTKKNKFTIGVCKDIQFNTQSYDLEWLFPKKYFLSATPVPSSAILEVTPQAIIIKNQKATERSEDYARPEKESIQESLVVPTPGTY